MYKNNTNIFQILIIKYVITMVLWMIHFSKTEITKLHEVEQLPITNFKPFGLWYSTDDIWLKYYRKNISKEKVNQYQYMYRLRLRYTSIYKPNKNKILKITNKADFDKFTLKYGSLSKNNYFILINWSDVALYYAGIEIMPLIESRMMSVDDPNVVSEYDEKFNLSKSTNIYGQSLNFWQYTLDIPSGCVWNPKAIKKFKRSYKI